MAELLINPKTKIYDLLEAFPQLEPTLIKMAPQFKKLQNPVLRKTITKITNLSQAATIAGLKVEEMVNDLRKEVGQSATEFLGTQKTQINTEQPDWYDDSKVADTVDIREMLQKGEQPVHEVLSAINRLNTNEILKVVAPFIPAPLIDKSLSMDHEHWLVERRSNEIWVFFRAKG